MDTCNPADGDYGLRRLLHLALAQPDKQPDTGEVASCNAQAQKIYLIYHEEDCSFYRCGGECR